MTRMVLVLALAALGALPAAAADQASPADAILGKWWFPKRNGKMEIVRQGDVYRGTVIEYEKPEQLDDKNPDPALKGRKFVGISMLDNFKYEPDNERWAGGTIYDAESGKTYKCRLWFEDGDLSRLNARGFVGLSIFGRTEIFERVTKQEEEAAEKTAADEAGQAGSDRNADEQ